MSKSSNKDCATQSSADFKDDDNVGKYGAGDTWIQLNVSVKYTPWSAPKILHGNNEVNVEEYDGKSLIVSHTQKSVNNVLNPSDSNKNALIEQLEDHIGKYSGWDTSDCNDHYKADDLKNVLSDSRNVDGSNLAHMACYKYYYTLINQLTEAGVLNKLNTASTDGYYPLDLFINCIQQKHAEPPKGSN